MPEDAVGVPRWRGAGRAGALPVPSQGGGTAASGPTAATPVGSGTSPTRRGAAQADDGGFVQHATDPRSLAGAALLAVGLIAALAGRGARGTGPAERRREAVETEVWLRVGRRTRSARSGSPPRCAAWPRSARRPGTRCRRRTPRAVDGDAVELYLAPPAPEAPAPWSAVDGGAPLAAGAARPRRAARSPASSPSRRSCPSAAT
jgi:hypothetical protein